MSTVAQLAPPNAVRVQYSVDLLRQAVADHGRVVYASSLGAEAIVLTDLICEQVPTIDIVTIDTGRLPDETLMLLERLERRYQRRIKVYTPDSAAIEDFVARHGINGFYNSVPNRQLCCQIRKFAPFQRAVAGYRAWVTGVRREQSDERAQVQPVELDARNGLYKVSPLLDWQAPEIWDYIRHRKLPYNPLHDRGYPSIGCAPCSRAVEPGAPERSGRWWWEQSDSRECGLQPRLKA